MGRLLFVLVRVATPRQLSMDWENPAGWSGLLGWERACQQVPEPNAIFCL